MHIHMYMYIMCILAYIHVHVHVCVHQPTWHYVHHIVYQPICINTPHVHQLTCIYKCTCPYISLHTPIHTLAYSQQKESPFPAWCLFCTWYNAPSGGRMVWYCGRYCRMERCPIADNRRPTTVTTWPTTCALATDWSLHPTPPMSCKFVSHPFCWFCVSIMFLSRTWATCGGHRKPFHVCALFVLKLGSDWKNIASH